MTRTNAAQGMTERRPYLTRADVARILGVAPNTVTRWAREGRLPCLITLGGHHRFDPGVIEALRGTLLRGSASAWDSAPEEAARPGGRR